MTHSGPRALPAASGRTLQRRTTSQIPECERWVARIRLEPQRERLPLVPQERMHQLYSCVFRSVPFRFSSG